MSINKWRSVRYTDEGCSIYQCLNCYKEWESRTVPGNWIMYDEYGKLDHYIYKPIFKYCPFCSIQWEGQHFGYTYEDNDRSLGKRRFLIRHKILARYNKFGFPQRPPKKVWKIQIFRNKNWEPWAELYYDSYKKQDVLKIFRLYKKDFPKYKFKITLNNI